MSLSQGSQIPPPRPPQGRAQFDAKGPSADALKSVRSHPAFPRAMRTALLGLVGLFQGNRLLNIIVNDRGRTVISYMSVYIHHFGLPDDPEPGLTVSRMRKICAEQNVCSPGRAETILVVLRLFGYLTAGPSVGDRRRRVLVPTQKLIDTFQQRWEIIFCAMTPIFPDATAVLAAMQRPDFTRAFVRQLGDHFLAGLRVLDHAPGLELFAERNAGVMVAFSLVLASTREDGTPVEGATSVSISALARRFGVSRVHVRKQLRDAVTENYLQRMPGDEGQFLLLPRFRDAIENFMTTGFLFLAHCAHAALDEIDPRASA